uniref:Uncharacterized protein n=1 Tax=Anguilla anguilla TaxID=7936 RepID=A0A0E9XJE9_ANGAN
MTENMYHGPSVHLYVLLVKQYDFQMCVCVRMHACVCVCVCV